MAGEVKAQALPAVLLTALVLPIPTTGMPLKLPVILKEVYRFPEWEDATTALVPVLRTDTGTVSDGMIVVVRSGYRTFDSDEPTWSMSYWVVRYDLNSGPRVLPVSGGPSGLRSDPRMYPIGAFYDPDRDRLLVVTYHPCLILPGGDETSGVLVSGISGVSRDPRFVGYRTLTIAMPNDVDDVKPVLPEVVDGRPRLVYVEPGEPFEEGGTREYRLVRLDLETCAREVLAEFTVSEPGWRVNLGRCPVTGEWYYLVVGPGWAVAVRESDGRVVRVRSPEGWTVRFSEYPPPYVSIPTTGEYVILDSADLSRTALGRLRPDGSIEIVLRFRRHWDVLRCRSMSHKSEDIEWIAAYSSDGRRCELALGYREIPDEGDVLTVFPLAERLVDWGGVDWVGPFVLVNSRVLYLVELPMGAEVRCEDGRILVISEFPYSYDREVVLPGPGVEDVRRGDPSGVYEVIPAEGADTVTVTYRFLGPFFVAERELTVDLESKCQGFPCLTVVPPIRRRTIRRLGTA